MTLDFTHDAAVRSWLVSANTTGNDFPIQNLPLAVLRRAGSSEAFRGAVAIGDQALDLAALAASGVASGPFQDALEAASGASLKPLMAAGPQAWRALRHGLFATLREGADETTMARVRMGLLPLAGVEYALPAQIANYTDFYTSLDHARNVGRIVRPDAEVTPNFRWMPIAYHGRASSVVVSGQPVRRPVGQSMPPGATTPVVGPCARLDYELELAIWIGPGNAQGEPIAIADAEQHIFGIGLLNDWSARDIQFWEMAPLGPFLGKNFATSVSPWIVTLEALAPFRAAPARPSGDPQALPYLIAAHNTAAGALDIQLEVALQTRQHRQAQAEPARLSRTSFCHQYWTVAQMVAHHTMGGCNLHSGDLLGSGTISGPGPGEAGAIIELTKAGQQPLVLPDGQRRAFLEDGDAVVLRGWCERVGFARIGFGECSGEVLPAKER